MTVGECLKLKESNCKNCYKCIRHCPVKAIRFDQGQAHIVQTECILCGQCFVICPQNAKSIRDDLPVAKALVKGEAPVYASVAPTFVANYPDATIEAMGRALARLGFAGAEETALGATVVKKRYDQLCGDGEHRVLLSSCCHSVNLLIQQYYPGALPYLAPVLSPMLAHCKDLKRRHPDAKTLFIGPCISKKAEGDESDLVDCVLTFEELAAWFQEEGIVLESTSQEEERGKARLFPVPGGILKTMNADCEQLSYLAVDGVDNCIRLLEDIEKGEIKDCFIEMSACPGSCAGGPAMEREQSSPVGGILSVNRYAGSEDFAVDQPAPGELSTAFAFRGIHRAKPGRSAVEEVLRKMGKVKPADELNCGSCGYNTCREKAVAILAGKASLSMCLPYLMEKAESFSDTVINNSPNGIMVLNEQMEIQQINAAACKIINVGAAADVLGRQVVCVLDPTPFIEVVNTHRNIYDMPVYLAEYKRHIILTVVYDKSYNIVFSIMRDVTGEEEDRARHEAIRRQTIEITDKVIEKQMRAVQEIASLLGETTAETKVALTKLKETMRHE